MPFVAIPIAMPPNVAEVRAADLDADGRDELIAVSRAEAAGRPDAITLTVLHLDARGAEERRETLALGREALLWDADRGGLFAMDGKGVLRLGAGGHARLADLPTPLAWVGQTSPAAADIVHDLDGDGDAEVLAWSGGRLHAVASHGGIFGSLPLPATGELGSRRRAGGQGLRVTAAAAPLVVGDIDGDGLQDLSIVRGRSLEVWFTADTIGARSARIRLPRDLDPPRDRGARPEGRQRRLRDAWFSDIDGDGRLDLVIHDDILTGSWFGATAAITIHPGTGAAFGAPRTIETEAAVVDIQELDWEGDGDQDLIVSEIDVGMGNLARALVARRMSVNAWLYRADGAKRPEGLLLASLVVPIERPDAVHAELAGDLTGDGIVDLVTDQGEDEIRVFAGAAQPTRGRGFSAEPVARHAIEVPDVDGALMVRDLTGDGRAECLVWGPGRPTATVLRLD